MPTISDFCTWDGFKIPDHAWLHLAARPVLERLSIFADPLNTEIVSTILDTIEHPFHRLTELGCRAQSKALARLIP